MSIRNYSLLFILLILGSLVGLAPGIAQEDKTPDYAFTWPLEPPTEKQIAAARDCDHLSLVQERYPSALDIDDLPDAYTPENGCDWTALAVAYGARLQDRAFGDPYPEPAVEALVNAMTENPALIYTVSLLPIFGDVPLVEPPPLVDQSITEIHIEHEYFGLGSHLEYSVTLENADTEPTFRGEISTNEEAPVEIEGKVEVEIAQAFSQSLSNLVPIEQTFDFFACYDNYPDWNVTLIFEDGQSLEFSNYESNYYFFGGPMQMEIEDQFYMQYSFEVMGALADLIDAMEIPLGETAAMNCGFDEDILDLAFTFPDEDEGDD